MQEGQIIVFKIGNEEYAIHSLSVIEIDRMKEIKINIVPKVPAYIEGIINLRGDVVPVMDMRKKFGLLDKYAGGRAQRIIILRTGNNAMIGILVDSVSGVEYLEDYDLLPPTDEMSIDTAYISSIAIREDRIIFLLNIDNVAC